MPITHLPAALRPHTPWKNAGGTTQEIAISPANASLQNFTWRLSMARITGPGPFSLFPQTDRILTVLEGTLRLEFQDQSPISLAPLQPHAFSGESPCQGTPLNGPVLDLNIMLKRGHASAEIKILAAGQSVAATEATTTLIVALQPTQIQIEGHAYALTLHDAQHLSGVTTTVSVIQGQAAAITITTA